MDSEFVTVVTASPLTVQKPSGDIIPAIPVAGISYTSGQQCLALIQRSSIPVVLPLDTSGV